MSLTLKVARKKLALAAAAMIVIPILLLAAMSVFGKQPGRVMLAEPRRMLILAAHQDDCVIQAGGAAIRNASLGGTTSIVYLTRPDTEQVANTRRDEALQAWSLIDVTQANITFLQFEDGLAYAEAETLAAMKSALATAITANAPERVYIPLREGGSVDHDVLNRIAREVLAGMPAIEVVQSSEYNPYFLAERHPAKVLQFLLRLMPFTPPGGRTYGLGLASQVVTLALTPEELDLKKQMLMRFESQSWVIPMNQFGFTDVYDVSTKLPGRVLELSGKYFSLPSLLALASVCLGLLIAGLCVAGPGIRVWFAAALGAGLLIALLLAYLKYPRWFLEEFFYFIPLSLGILAGVCVELLGRRSADVDLSG